MDDGNASDENVIQSSYLNRPRGGIRTESLISRSTFLGLIAMAFGALGLHGCAIFFQRKADAASAPAVSKETANKYCRCVPVCTCDTVCTCNLVSSSRTVESVKKDDLTAENPGGLPCKCVPVCTCDTVCSCNAQCTCQTVQYPSSGGCSCNPYMYPN